MSEKPRVVLRIEPPTAGGERFVIYYGDNLIWMFDPRAQAEEATRRVVGAEVAALRAEIEKDRGERAARARKGGEEVQKRRRKDDWRPYIEAKTVSQYAHDRGASNTDIVGWIRNHWPIWVEQGWDTGRGKDLKRSTLHAFVKKLRGDEKLPSSPPKRKIIRARIQSGR
jgi:hypothetical protein